ncbi:hypothetical protein J007_06744 [Cryptococcus neoformans]|nr:hypothetical protein J007_06744 [Cryptococcus neoformans var. grubii]OXC57748.1 hypothetical protein C358_06838 [Cryptococcus neoformans var. grubii MW-RSA852]
MASWVSTFRSPSPCTDDESCLSVKVVAGANTDLIHDLDLSLREDKAVYNPNPFTLAKRKNMRGGGRKISNVISAEDRMKDVVPAVRSTPKTAKFKEYPKAITIPKDKETNSSKKEKPFATARHGPKPAVRNYLPPPIEEEVKPRSKKKSGWVDKDGNPLPDAPPRKKSIINIIEEKEAEEEKKAKKKAQAKEKRKRTVEVKKKKKTEEKIEFGLLPKGAGPTEEYPILLALDKQKSLPTKSQAKLKNGEATRSPRPKHNIVEDINDLVYGPAKTRNDKGDTATDPIDLGHSSEISDRKIRSDGSTSTLIGSSRANKSGDCAQISRLYQRSLPFKESYPSSSNYERRKFGSLAGLTQRPGLETPHTDDTAVGRDSMEHPSTMTRIPSSVTQAGDKSTTTASDLPYSSPLAGRGKMIGHTVGGKWKGKAYQSKEMYHPPSPVIARPVPRRFQRLVPIKPFRPPSRSPSPMWSTLPAPAKRRIPSSLSPLKDSKAFTSNKFRVPSLFPITRKRCLPQPPSSPRKLTRLTLFTPTSKKEDARRPISERSLYAINTIRSTTYGPSVVRNDMPDGKGYRPVGIKGRLTLPPGRSGCLSKTNTSGLITKWENKNDQQTQVSQNGYSGDSAYDYRDYQIRAGPSAAGDDYDEGHEDKADGDEEDWQSAWKRRNTGGTGAAPGQMMGRRRMERTSIKADEMDVAEQYIFQPHERY